ncbi:MAG TPA: hypothetical protein VGG64_02880 [Pirellulales bacterium]|jgi:hypothetical protein
MRLREWEVTIQQIADESNREAMEAGKQRVLTTWRAKLEKEPTSLQAFQIDEIVREVRRRITVTKTAPLAAIRA